MIVCEVEFVCCGCLVEIWVKMNSLIDKEVIEVLYDVSQVGVKISFVLCGICGLCLGIKGLFENICVKLIVGCFLEYLCIVCFGNGYGLLFKCLCVFFSFVDWMGCNLNCWVEVLVECNNEMVKVQIISQIMVVNMVDEV